MITIAETRDEPCHEHVLLLALLDSVSNIVAGLPAE